MDEGKRFLAFDLEFGGLDDEHDVLAPHRFGLTEISAACAWHPGDWSHVKVLGTFQTYVKPRADLWYDDEALMVQSEWLEGHWQQCVDFTGETVTEAFGKSRKKVKPKGEGFGIDDFEGDRQPTRADVFYDFLMGNGRDESQALLGFEKWAAHFFGGYENLRTVSPWTHNNAADIPFLKAACRRCGVNLPCNRAGRCSMILFRTMRDLGFHDRYKADQDTVMKHYGIELPPELRHTAGGDVHALVQIIGHMMRDCYLGVDRARADRQKAKREAAQAAAKAKRASQQPEAAVSR